ncbi:transporter substrate-binding domain-containing protein [Maridesulfovibrio sp. FT414]|uniref:transporter substrate-binding domain-containing protein n=1 Tax=Maridesulfovibrio sp. FT414 TaxID=2979469 RepID=UPI003D808BF1
MTVEHSRAENTVYWPFFDLPPLAMVSDDGTIQGVGPDVAEYLQFRLNEYGHQQFVASPLRIMRSLQEEKHWVATGVFKTPEREEFLCFSKFPCRLTWGLMAVIRKSDGAVIIQDGQLDPETVLSSGGYRLGYIRGVHYAGLNPVVDKYGSNSSVAYASSDLKNQIALLLKGRIDFFFADPLIVYYTSVNNHPVEEIGFAECKDSPTDPVLGYFAAPRNEWGRKIISRIDQILEEAIRSGDYKYLLNPWVPEQMRGRFDRDYREKFESLVQ